MKHLRTGIAVAILSTTALSTPAIAQGATDAMTELRRELDAIRAEQARSNQRIAELEAALARATSTQTAQANSTAGVGGATAMAVAPVAPVAIPASTSPAKPSRLTFSGDLRSRYESNFGDSDAPDRNRLVFRARLRANYAVNDWLSVGGQLATGDPNDPNSTDLTLSKFDDKLLVNLDQAFIRAKFGGLQVDAGRFAQPFTRTELVWDGDVSPQGISATYTKPLGQGVNLKAAAMYFMVDEVVAGPDSDMVGGQLGLDFAPSPTLKFELAAAYYDYSLRSVAGGDSGDFRGNIMVGGSYLSDFDLFDVIGAVNWSGLGAKWPVRIVGDYVKNYGAANSEDSGYGIDLIVGRASKPHDWRFTYGYARAEADAVLNAFSQDNTNIASNYKQHTLGLDYTITSNLILNATYYRYRPLHALYAGSNDPRDWLNRLRFNAMVTF